MVFEKKIELTFEDRYQYSLFLSKQRIALTMLIEFFAILIIFALNDVELRLSLFASILGAFIYLLLAIILMKRRIRKSSANRLCHIPQLIRLDQNGVFVSSEVGTSELSWQDFKSAKESEHAFYLTIQGTASYIIPKRLLNQNEAAIVRMFIGQHILDRKPA